MDPKDITETPWVEYDRIAAEVAVCPPAPEPSRSVPRLEWYRDIGNGQAAADATPGVEQLMDGSWPIARLYGTGEELRAAWTRLWSTHGVNAMTHYPPDYHGPVVFDS